MEDREVVKEFLIESGENLSCVEQQMVELEKQPKDPQLLAAIFRTIHTIKGTCGFLGFTILESITHVAENVLNQLRDGKTDLTPSLVTLILDTVDVTTRILRNIEITGREGEDVYEDLRRRLAAAQRTDLPMPPPPREQRPAGIVPAAEVDFNAQKGPAAADSTIRVDVRLLDKLMNLVGELVLVRNQILQSSAREENATLNAASQRLNLITTQLQESVMKTRMQPIGMLWSKLPRMVRDLASACGKQIELVMEGAETELDKSILEAIKDPLTHIVRNCCDHGIEAPAARARAGKSSAGTLTLRAFHAGGQVNIEISDDGRGVDLQRIREKSVQKGFLSAEQVARMTHRELVNLLFLPGFSTTERVTSISGRGVGLDVVKTNIEKIGGVVDLSMRVGKGTSIKIKIPLTLAILPGLVVTIGERRSGSRAASGINERFIIPQVNLLDLLRLEGANGRKQIESIHGTPVYRWRGRLLPIAYLREVLKLGQAEADSGVVNIVVLQAGDRPFGLVVDGISDTQEIVVKPLGGQLKGLSCYAGATIMGDGQVALVLDVLGVGQISGVLAAAREPAHADKPVEREASPTLDRQTYLLFRAGLFDRLAVPLSLVARLEEFPQSRIERTGARLVTQYRDRILPLVALGTILDPSSEDTASRADPVQAVVFHDGERRVGLMVDRILDILDETVVVKEETDRPGLLGSAVIGDKVADLIDLKVVLERSSENWFGRRPAQAGATVLVADGSTFARGLLRSYLEIAGHRVMEAAGCEEALAQLERTAVDVVAVSLDLPPRGGLDFLEQMRKRPKLARIPVLALRGGVGEDTLEPGRTPHFEDCQMKFDREAMVCSVYRLAVALETEQPTAELTEKRV